ncbi:MAG: hypothetical protein ACI8P3_000195 [Saprospiraceae bacterium]|jgi:hypothetical protein
MPRLKIMPALFIFTFLSNFLFAQASADNSDRFVAKGITLTEAPDQDWSIYNDEENNLYYIDFEKISFNLSEVVVLNENNQVVFIEEVFDLPVNTIYELDFNSFGPGKFSIELRSFTKFIQQDVLIK